MISPKFTGEENQVWCLNIHSVNIDRAPTTDHAQALEILSGKILVELRGAMRTGLKSLDMKLQKPTQILHQGNDSTRI